MWWAGSTPSFVVKIFLLLLPRKQQRPGSADTPDPADTPDSAGEIAWRIIHQELSCAEQAVLGKAQTHLVLARMPGSCATSPPIPGWPLAAASIPPLHILGDANSRLSTFIFHRYKNVRWEKETQSTWRMELSRTLVTHTPTPCSGLVCPARLPPGETGHSSAPSACAAQRVFAVRADAPAHELGLRLSLTWSSE